LRSVERPQSQDANPRNLVRYEIRVRCELGSISTATVGETTKGSQRAAEAAGRIGDIKGLLRSVGDNNYLVKTAEEIEGGAVSGTRLENSKCNPE
jgi:hypothetical protein